jgi:hypothetical protein
MEMAMKGLPYASATSGTKAHEDIRAILRRLGVEAAGVMDDFSKNEVIVAFTHRGRKVQLRASASGWAQMFLRENPNVPSRESMELSPQGEPSGVGTRRARSGSARGQFDSTRLD